MNMLKNFKNYNINDKILLESNFYKRKSLEKLYGQNSSLLIIKLKKLIEKL